MEITIEQALPQGIKAHKEGKAQDAERLYRTVLQCHPLHPDDNHNIGVLAVSVNKAGAALPFFQTALEANPKIEQFWLSHIDTLIKFIAQDIDGYIQLAVKMAANTNYLKEIRAGLRERMQRAPLCDGHSFASDVESAYQEMWHRYQT
jgi:hypothetical protein